MLLDLNLHLSLIISIWVQGIHNLNALKLQIEREISDIDADFRRISQEQAERDARVKQEKDEIARLEAIKAIEIYQ